MFSPAVPEADRKRMESDRAAAFDKAKGEPSAENIIWLGRRTAYLGGIRSSFRAM